MGGAEAHDDSAGCRAADRPRSRDRRSSCTGRSSIVAGRRSPTSRRRTRRDAGFHHRVGIERSPVGVDLRPTAVLGRLDRAAVAVLGEPVVARVVHPDPHREPSRCERREVRRGKYVTCSRRSRQRDRWPSGSSSTFVQASADHDCRAAALRRPSVTTSTSPPTGRIADRRVLDVASAPRSVPVAAGSAVARPAGTMPVSGGRSPSRRRSRRPAANAGHRRRTSPPSIHSYGTPTSSRLAVYDPGRSSRPAGTGRRPPVAGDDRVAATRLRPSAHAS